MKSAKEQVEEIYRGFCEADGGTDDQFSELWDRYEYFNGKIKAGSLVEQLILAAMEYAIELADLDDLAR